MSKHLVLSLIALSAYSGCAYTPPFEVSGLEAMRSGYSCQWKCIITTEGKWTGTFGGKESRSLQGIGNAEVCLPDSNDMKYASIMKWSEGGLLTAQIVGPEYQGHPVSTDVLHGLVFASANETEEQRKIREETSQKLHQVLD